MNNKLVLNACFPKATPSKRTLELCETAAPKNFNTVNGTNLKLFSKKFRFMVV